MRYDCENSISDELHHRLHFIITKILTNWNVPITVKTLSLLSNNQKSNSKTHKLLCDVLIELTPNFELLSVVGRERFLENLENALRLNKLKIDDVYTKITEFLRNYEGFNEGIGFFYDKFEKI